MSQAMILHRSPTSPPRPARIRRAARLTSIGIHRRARAARVFAVARAARASLSFLRKVLGRWLVIYRQNRAAAETMRALRALDDRTLHDLGYDRSQIQSIAIELSRAR